MMKGTFIYKVAEYIFRNHGDNPGRVRVIFPNRRAGLFFNHALSGMSDHPLWAPEVLTIRDLVEEHTGKKVSDTLYLVMALYDVFKEVTGSTESFEEFYPWGEMLLGDFDDIDKYLADAKDLFRNLKAEQELLQDLSYLTEEQITLIRHFWDHFPAAGEQGEAGKFKNIWEKLYPVYEKFRKVLVEKELAYEGMLYRELGEKIREGMPGMADTGPVYLVGFNALTPAEELLFDFFKNTGHAKFFWDYDTAYITTKAGAGMPGHDAGRFIRKYIHRFPPPEDLAVFDNLLAGDKDIRVYSSPNRTAQSWVVHTLLKEWMRDPLWQKERTAVVLADEGLLLSVLHALPEESGDINVTMGYPLQDSPVFAFYESALSLMKNKTEDKQGKTFFFYRDVLDLLHNPLLAGNRKPGWEQWEKEIIQQNRIYLSREEIQVKETLMPVFRTPGDPADYGRILLDVLYGLVTFSTGNDDDTGFNIEGFYQLYLLVNRLNDFLEDKKMDLPLPGYLNLLLYLARQAAVTFYGEPLTGIQVMGILETRLLDFDRVIILSVNEGSMPKPAAAASYIPYSLRKGFGLPAYEHRDAVYAYYFYRLIQRARHVALVWHTESDAGQKGEKSRFISQLQYLTRQELQEKDLYFSPGMEMTKELKVQKDEKAIARIRTLASEGENYLSPSALNTWLSCRLRFYYKYVAGITEPEEMEEDMDAALFGRLLHKAMERIYTPWLNREVTEEVLEDILRNKLYSKAVEESFVSELYGGKNGPAGGLTNGVHLIIRSSLEKYIRKVLEYDRNHIVPFTVTGLEKKVVREADILLNGQIITVRLGGKIDRMDKVNGRLRLIDYKTGQKKSDFESIGQLFDPEEKKRNTAAFQILMYVWITGKGQPPAFPELYFVREMFKSDNRQQIKMGPGRKRTVFDPDENRMLVFEDLLKKLLEDLFDPAVPFDQTPHADFCKNCPYNVICNR